MFVVLYFDKCALNLVEFVLFFNSFLWKPEIMASIVFALGAHTNLELAASTYFYDRVLLPFIGIGLRSGLMIVFSSISSPSPRFSDSEFMTFIADHRKYRLVSKYR